MTNKVTNKVVRSPAGVGFRDTAGKYTALSFPTKWGYVWISNKALCIASGFVLGLLATFEPSAAKTVLFNWVLRLTTFG
jgi:hypothetical protein